MSFNERATASEPEKKDIDPRPVPKILYQTYKTNELPANFASYRDLWLRLLSNDHETPLLLDNDLREMVSKNFPQYLTFYDGCTHNIERVDFARNIMMWLGGIYADLDTFPVKDIRDWTRHGRVVLGTEPYEHAEQFYGKKVILCNAFMISPPRASLWIDLMDYIVRNYKPNSDPVYTTGPIAMTRFWEENPRVFEVNQVIITEPSVFFPLRSNGTLTRGCNFAKDTYVVHVWTNTWVTKWYMRHKIILFLAVLLAIIVIIFLYYKYYRK